MKKIYIFVLFMMLPACFGGYSPNSSFYNLMVDNKVSAVSDKKLNIGVSNVVLPDYMDRPQIAVFSKDSPNMKISEFERWGENLDMMIQRTLAADLSRALPNSVVKSKDALTEGFDLLVNVQIVRFDFIWNDEAVFEAWWSITNKNGKILHQDKTSLYEKVGDSYTQYVKAESSMIGQMSMEIAQRLSLLRY